MNMPLNACPCISEINQAHPALKRAQGFRSKAKRRLHRRSRHACVLALRKIIDFDNFFMPLIGRGALKGVRVRIHPVGMAA